jgi:hypothetical protein
MTHLPPVNKVQRWKKQDPRGDLPEDPREYLPEDPREDKQEDPREYLPEDLQEDKQEQEDKRVQSDDEYYRWVKRPYQSQPTDEEVWREELLEMQGHELQLDRENQEKQSDRENWYACNCVPKEMQQYMEWSLLDLWQKQHPQSDYPLQPPREDQPPAHVQMKQLQELCEKLMYVRKLQLGVQ